MSHTAYIAIFSIVSLQLVSRI